MNVLPVVLSFLLIFSCISLTFLKEIKSSFIIETAFQGFNAAERKVNNKLAQKAYNKIPKYKEEDKSSKESNPDRKKEKNYQYSSQRVHFPPYEISKFNLNVFTQLSSTTKQHPMYEILARFLRLLYQEHLFSKENNSSKMEYRLIDAWIKQLQTHPETKNIYDLCPKDPALYSVCYKMLKGTNQYDRKHGIPPLGDFLCLSKEKTAISLNFASELLLEALFDGDTTQAVLQEEKNRSIELKKNYHFSKEDLQNCLQKCPTHASNVTAWEAYLNFSKQHPRVDQLEGKDKETGIHVKKALHTSSD